MAPAILFQWDISNFNGPFDNLNAPKGRKWDMAFKCIFVWCGFNNGVLTFIICVLPGTCTCKVRESQKGLCDLCVTANTSVHLTLKELTWTAAKSCDKILIQNLYLSSHAGFNNTVSNTFWLDTDNHDILKYIFNHYGQIKDIAHLYQLQPNFNKFYL